MLACWFVSFSFYYFPNVVSYNFLATQLKPSLVIVEAVQSTGAGGFILASEVASTKLLQWRQILKACFTFTKQDSIEDHPRKLQVIMVCATILYSIFLHHNRSLCPIEGACPLLHSLHAPPCCAFAVLSGWWLPE